MNNEADDYVYFNSTFDLLRIEHPSELGGILAKLERFSQSHLGIDTTLVVQSMSHSSRKIIRYLLREHGYVTRRKTFREWFHRGQKLPFRSPIRQRIVLALVWLLYLPLTLIGSVVRYSLFLVGRGTRVYVLETDRNAGPAAAAGGDNGGPFGSGDREPRNPLTPLPAIGMDPRAS